MTQTDLAVYDNLDSEMIKQQPTGLEEFSSFDLTGFTEADDYLRYLDAEGRELTEIGDGFYPLDKDSCVGKRMVVLGSRLFDGEYGLATAAYVMTWEDVQIAGTTEAVRKGILIDGSTTGIHHQLLEKRAGGMIRDLIAPRGLRRSDYEVEDAKGNTIPAHTFYLS